MSKLATGTSTFPPASSFKYSYSTEDFKNVRVSMATEYRQFLASTTVGQAFPSQEIFFAKSTDSIANVFHRLIEKKIMAVPVYDMHTHKYVAWIDILDIMVYVIERLQLNSPNRVPNPTLEFWVTQSDFAARLQPTVRLT